MRTRGQNEGDERGGSLLEGGGVEGETSSGEKQTNQQTKKHQTTKTVGYCAEYPADEIICTLNPPVRSLLV